MKKTISLVLAIVMVLTIGVTSINCSSVDTTNPAVSPTPTPTAPKVTQVPFQKTAEDFIKNSATYKFDGIDGSLQIIEAEEYGPTSSFRSIVFTFTFQTAHPGHGDRSGQYLAQVIINHTVVLYVDMDQDIVRTAICDETWDMLTEKDISPVPPIISEKDAPTAVSGIVISGGDTARPDGPLDVPHKFVYQIQQTDGTTVNVSYTAYPPSPVGDAQRARITLDFHDGSINIGDRLEAFGTLDKESNTVVVADQGDFLKTYPHGP